MQPRESDLAAYYDQEAARRAARQIDPHRVERRDWFASLVRAEGRSRLLEVGTGPGQDAVAFQACGLTVSGVDLSPAHVRLARGSGVEVSVASVLALPFADDAFDAGWTMSTLLHVPDARFDRALAEIRRVLQPGSPLAVGLWGGEDFEGPSDKDQIRPPRFFSVRSHERLQQMLGRHGDLEQFETWGGGDGGWSYQWCVLRLA